MVSENPYESPSESQTRDDAGFTKRSSRAHAMLNGFFAGLLLGPLIGIGIGILIGDSGPAHGLPDNVVFAFFFGCVGLVVGPLIGVCLGRALSK